MKIIFLLFLCILTATNPAHADELDIQARRAIHHYQTTCIKFAFKIDKLRETLQRMWPALPPEKAKLFLSGQEGRAWPIPDKNGFYVLALHDKTNYCAVFARRANVAIVEEEFTQMLLNPPEPMIATRFMDQWQDSNEINGRTHTLAYTWGLPDTKLKILFMTTTATKKDAELQAILSVKITSDP